MAKYISHYSGKRIDRSVGMIPDTNPTEDGVLVISKTGEGGYKKVSEVGATVVQETGNSETQVMSQKAVTNALGTKVDEQGVEGMISETIVQETGEATDKVMSQDATTKELSKKLNLIEPTGVQTDFVLIRKNSDESVQQMSLTGVFTPQKKYDTFLPVLRGLQGQLRGQTAPSDKQDNLDLINRAELTEKLAAKKLYRHYATLDTPSYGSCKLSFISLKSDAYSSAENLSELKDVVSVEYCTIGDSGYRMGTIFINPLDGDYVLMTAEHSIVISTVSSFTDTATEL